jgi:hypothetical protein
MASELFQFQNWFPKGPQGMKKFVLTLISVALAIGIGVAFWAADGLSDFDLTEHSMKGRCCMEHEEVGTRPTRDGFQAVRSNLGRPSSVIRLRIRTPILASVF